MLDIYRRLACPVAIPYARSRFSINFPEEQKTAAEAAKCLKNRLYVYDDEKIKMINNLCFSTKINLGDEETSNKKMIRQAWCCHPYGPRIGKLEIILPGFVVQKGSMFQTRTHHTHT